MDILPKRYDPAEVESRLQKYWEENGINRFQNAKGPVYAIDTPPPTVSGDLHMGHCYSYSQTDFYARYHRMRGEAVFYPMGWDDNGLPTERLIEKRLGITPESAGTEAFLRAIVETSGQLEQQYEQLWRRLGLSVDWRYAYSTISPAARRSAQYSFLDLYKKGRVFNSSAPTIWCPVCKTAIAHAEVADLQRNTEFVTLAFKLEGRDTLPIATTRPEMLPACVAIFVNPADRRYCHLTGHSARAPLFNKEVPIIGDPLVDPEKGTGAVMCCTFGDSTDIKWWREYRLPLINIINADGKLNEIGGILAGLDIKTARRKIIEELNNAGLVLKREPAAQTVSVHERCETPVEYLETRQWFIKILDQKERLLEAGEQISWHPPYMRSRYEDWVRHLEWDWCISRQRYHGVPFPVWYCAGCGEIVLAEASELPVDPHTRRPSKTCRCGNTDFIAESSVMDTWMTSSVSPQIAGKWLEDKELFEQVFPMSLRPQAHDIIRTWAFYTIVKSLYHFQKTPWLHIAISGHGLSPEGHKVSKSKGTSVIDPLKMMGKYSADALRYWAASSKLGEDSMISEDKIAFGQRLINKLWSVAGFAQRFLQDYRAAAASPPLLPVDKWALSRLQRLIQTATECFENYDHAQAKIKIEFYFWDILADNYLEMVKVRLYDFADGSTEKESASYTLFQMLATVLKLLAPLMPYVTEEIYQRFFGVPGKANSIHLAEWPRVQSDLVDNEAEALGEAMVEIATAVRRYKSENKLPMGTPLERIIINTSPGELTKNLIACETDIGSVTRAKSIRFARQPEDGKTSIVQVKVE
ncbi:MAG TPA: valine--tRNA ligase [Dehalococcoidales bacterium]